MNQFKLFILIMFLSISLNANELNHAKSYRTGISQAIQENKQVVLFVYSDYCSWCKKMENTTLKDNEVVNYLNENFIFIAVNQDKDIFPNRFIPYGVPTTYIIDPKKEEKLYTLKGYKSKSSFLGRLKI